MTRTLNDLANEFLTRPAVPRCCLCGCEIRPGQPVSNVVHAGCERDELNSIDADVRTLLYAGMTTDADWIASMERDYGHCRTVRKSSSNPHHHTTGDEP